MLEVIMGLLAAFDVTALGDLAEAGGRIAGVTEAGYRLP
jgi:hypothetical protein